LSRQNRAWVIAGGESGNRKTIRPTHPDWFRKVRDDCAESGVPFFLIQWGEWFPRTAACELLDDDGAEQLEELEISGRWAHWRDGQWMCRVGKKTAGRLLDGREWNEFPVSSEVRR
jgi:protein gp37